jgi:hypothetical protein
LLLSATGAWAGEKTTPPALGVLPPVTVEVRLEVPRDGVWQAPQTAFVLEDTAEVRDADRRRGAGADFRVYEGTLPPASEFIRQPKGVFIFSPRDTGRVVIARYQYAPRRVVVFEPTAQGEYPEAAGLFAEALDEELTKRGFAAAPPEQTTEAAAALGLGAVAPEKLPPAGKLAALAGRLNAIYVIIPSVALGCYSESGTANVEVERPKDRVGDQHPRNPMEESSVPVRVANDRLSGGIRMAVVDGATGGTVFDQAKSSSEPVRWRRFAAARRALARNLAAEVVKAWRGEGAAGPGGR